MAVLNREEYFNRLHSMVGTDTSEDALSFLEDMSDTYNSISQANNNNNTDWERKYHELDESWKERYRHRFFSSGDNGYIPEGAKPEKKDEYNPDAITVNDLFS